MKRSSHVKRCVWTVSAVAALLGGCTDYADEAEGMVESALGGVDCKVTSVQTHTEDVGKVRRRTLTVVYQPSETLYLKTLLGGRKVVQQVVSEGASLTATLRFERGRGAAEPTILSLCGDPTLDDALMARSQKGGWAGCIPEDGLSAIAEDYLKEGTEAYATLEAQVERQEAEARAKAEAERKAQEAALAAQRAKEEAERKAREEAIAAQRAKEEAEREARACRALEARIRARFAELGISDTISVSKILSSSNTVTVFECTSTMTLVKRVATGISGIEGANALKNMPQLVILEPCHPPGTVFPATFKDDGYSWLFESNWREGVPKSFVNRSQVGLILGTPAYEEFAAVAKRVAAIDEKIKADRARLREIGSEKTEARTKRVLFLDFKLRQLDKEREAVQARIKANQSARHAANQPLWEHYQANRGRILTEAIGIPRDFGEL